MEPGGEIGFDGIEPLSGARAPGYFAFQRTIFMKLSYDSRPETRRPGKGGAPIAAPGITPPGAPFGTPGRPRAY